MRPQCKITIDGNLASGLFMERLTSCQVVDNDGEASDTISIELNDFPPATIPRKGAIIRAWMGYGTSSLTLMGEFTVDQVGVKILPGSMSITGRSADFREDMKSEKSRHWDDASLSDIVGQIASENGFEAKVDEDIGSFTYPWQGQDGEHDFQFLQRLADRHDAIFSIKDGKLIIAAKGKGETPSGATLPEIVVRPEILGTGSASVTFADRTEFGTVRGSYYDRDEAKLKFVEVDGSETGSAIQTIPVPFSNEADAQVGAATAAKRANRASATTSCTVIGDPGIKAGCPMTYAVGRPGVDGLKFMIKSVTHDFSKSGYTSSIQAEAKV